MLPNDRLRACVERVTSNCSEMPYECDDEQFVAWQSSGEEITMSAADRPLRMRATYRVVIFSHGEYERLKLQLYAALLADGFALIAMPGEIYNDTTGRHQWPIDVQKDYDLLQAMREAGGIEE